MTCSIDNKKISDSNIYATPYLLLLRFLSYFYHAEDLLSPSDIEVARCSTTIQA